MGEVLKLPRRKKAIRQKSQERVLAQWFDDPRLQAAFMALYDNDKWLDRVVSRTFQEIFKRLETLEALVFAQSIMIAELRGHPLTPEQKRKIADILA
jgi:hypothetical protein